MSRYSPKTLQHVYFLLNELEVELKSLEAADDAVKALAQLTEREAEGQPLVEVCGATMRSVLAKRVAASPVTVGLGKLADLRTAMAIADRSEATTDTVTGTPDVIKLSQWRAQKSVPSNVATAAVRPVRRFGHAIAVSLALAAMTATGWPNLPTIGRGSLVDIAANTPSMLTARSQTAGVDRY